MRHVVVRSVRMLVVACSLSLACLAVLPGSAHAADPPLVEAERVEAFSAKLEASWDLRSHERQQRRFELTFEGRRLTYTGPIGEPRNHRFEQGTVELELDDETLARILEIFDESAMLASDFEETPGARSQGESVNIALSASDLGRSATVTIQGTTNAMGEETEPALLSAEASKRAQVLLGLCWTLKDLAEAASEGAESP